MVKQPGSALLVSNVFMCLSTFILGISSSAQGKSQPDSLVIERFTNCAIEERRCPNGWKATNKDVTMFSIQKEADNLFLHVNSKDQCTTIGKACGYSVQDYPLLSWRWQAEKLPAGGNEYSKKTNDSGAGVYVIFKGIMKLNKIIKYVWSSTLPQGTVTPSPYNGLAKIVVLRSGTDSLGMWLCEKVDLLADYERLFGGTPPVIDAIGLMSDADNTNSSAIANYDDFVASKGHKATVLNYSK